MKLKIIVTGPHLVYIVFFFFVVGCAPTHVRRDSAPSLAAVPATGNLADLPGQIEKQRLLNRQAEQLIDAVDRINDAGKVLGNHPRYSGLRTRVLEWEAKAFVDPPTKEIIATQLAASLSDQDTKLLLKIVELLNQGHDFGLKIKRYGKQQVQLYERKQILIEGLSADWARMDSTTLNQKTPPLISLLNELSAVWKRQEQLALSLKNKRDAFELQMSELKGFMKFIDTMLEPNKQGP